jgi:hypothetical protein
MKGILSKNRVKFPKFELSSSENIQDSNFGNLHPQNIEKIQKKDERGHVHAPFHPFFRGRSF